MTCGWSMFLLTVSCIWVLLPGQVELSHFRGGTITWRSLGQPNGNQRYPKIEISYRMAWRRSFGEHFCTADDIASGKVLPGEGSLSCTCSNLNVALSYICTDFNEDEDWTTGINSAQYQPTIPIFDIWFSGCCWISLENGGSSWDIRATVDLTVHNGRINSSPTTTMMPLVRLQRECNNTITIPVSDPDGDHVRCYWATQRCGDICGGLPSAFLHSDTCTLTLGVNDSPSGIYGVAIEIKDFATPDSSNALSVIPLQFLLDLISSPESCV